MHFVLKLIALFNKAIESIHAMPRLQAVVKRDVAVVLRETVKFRKADKASMAAYAAYRRVADKRDAQMRTLRDAERALGLSNDKLHAAELSIAQATAEAIHQRAIPAYDRVGVVLNEPKLDWLESVLVEAKVGVATNSVESWKEQVELMTERLADAPEGLVEGANDNVCHAIRRQTESEALLADMKLERDDYQQWLERRRQEKEEARIERKMRRFEGRKWS